MTLFEGILITGVVIQLMVIITLVYDRKNLIDIDSRHSEQYDNLYEEKRSVEVALWDLGYKVTNSPKVIVKALTKEEKERGYKYF